MSRQVRPGLYGSGPPCRIIDPDHPLTVSNHHDQHQPIDHKTDPLFLATIPGAHQSQWLYCGSRPIRPPRRSWLGSGENHLALPLHPSRRPHRPPSSETSAGPPGYHLSALPPHTTAWPNSGPTHLWCVASSASLGGLSAMEESEQCFKTSAYVKTSVDISDET
jgi:hypothetical protein